MNKNSDLKLFGIVFAIMGLIFVALTALSFVFFKSIAGKDFLQKVSGEISALVEDLDTDTESTTPQARNTFTNETTSTSNVSIQIKTNQPTSANTSQEFCINYTITNGEFKSSNCYSQNDYNSLANYIAKYNSAVSMYNGASASMEITCDGSDFFKDSCARDKEQKEKSANDIEKYKNLIKAIILKGN